METEICNGFWWVFLAKTEEEWEYNIESECLRPAEECLYSYNLEDNCPLFGLLRGE